MLKEKTEIGPGLLFMVLFAPLVGYGLMQSPYIAAEQIGNNGYWGFVLAFVPAVGLIGILDALGRRFPQKSLIQYLPDVCGPFWGRILGFIYLLFMMAVLTISSILAVLQSETYFLFRTPSWALILFFLGISAYIAHQGIEGIARLSAFVFPVTFVLSVLSIAFSFQNFELDNIRPVCLIDGFKIPLGAVQMFYPFFPLSTVLLIYPYLTEKQKGFKTILGAASLAFIIILVTIVNTIGNFSAPGILRYSWPVIEVTRKANLPFVLQTFGLFFTAAWLTLTLAGTGFFYYVLAEGSAQLLRRLNYKWFTLVLFPLIYCLMMLLTGVIEVRYIFSYFCVIGAALSLGIPLLVWFLAVIKRWGEKKDAA
ncbi:GerAB/ArcD/ProY family transporter [Candidatus Formimonas warabiya]|uniref:GerAB/ArcD/ProY family transporter n=1 Tax=Formimonas warabiya TaxID=1761012 RepID=A0A3G1KVQ8_FORW1|nr:endospore germination permease [Candidatus Formimonas warabiya]ATW26511.1 hypothetical protein DCMF_18710 [Candidatus Formimonas warabiya]